MRFHDRKTRENGMDMLQGSLPKQILLFALPLALSGMLQQLFNSADVAVVGRFAGSQALAAVGANSPIVALFVGMLTGMAVGANVVIAQTIGKNEPNRIHDAVHTSMLLAALLGIVVMLIGIVLARPILVAIGAPAEVMDQAVLYLRIYMLAVPFLGIYNFGAAVLRSIGDTKRPMYCLIFSGILNVCLNLVLVVAFHLGVAGVAIATAISSAVSAMIVVSIMTHEPSAIRLDLRKLRIQGSIMKKIIMIGGPAAIQGMVFSLSNICLQTGINSFGTDAMAGSAAAVNFEFLNFYMVTAFNSAAVSFLGQNYGAGQKKRCKQAYMVCLLEALVGVCLLEVLYFVFQDFFLGLYTTEPAVRTYARIRMNRVLIVDFLICTYEVTGSALRGIGKSLLPAVITIVGSVCFRLLWLVTVFARWHTFTMLVMVYPASWVLTGAMMFVAYFLVGRPMLKEN